MKSLANMMNKRAFALDVDFGRVYTDAEIRPIESEAKTLQSKLSRAEATLKNLNVKNIVEDLPKLNAYQRGLYKSAKTDASRSKRRLNEIMPKLNWMKLSQELPRIQPNIFNLDAYASKKNKTIAEIFDEYREKHIYVFYPQYIEAMARYNQRYHKTFVNADENRPLKYWLDEAVKSEDKKWGNGETPIADLVKSNFEKYALMKDPINNIEKIYTQDAVRDHIGHGTKNFTKTDINKVLSQAAMEPTPIDLPQIYDATPSTFDDNMGSFYLDEIPEEYVDYYEMGFFKKLFKAILSPIQKFHQSVFNVVFKNTIGSSLIRKNIPSSLYNNLAGLSQASSNILVGKIDKKNLRNAVKYAIRMGAEMQRPFTEITRAQYNALMSTSIGRDLDKYSGGLATSFRNLNTMSTDIAKGREIDYKARAIDGLKVGLAAAGGASAVAISTGTNLVGDKTGLNKSSTGRLILSAGAAVAGGANANTVASTTVKTFAKQQVQKTVMPTVEKAIGTTGANILYASGSAAIVSPTPKESFFETLGKEVKDEAKKRALRQVGKVAGHEVVQKLDSAYSDYQKAQDVYNKVSKYSNMTEEEFQQNVLEERNRLESRIESEIAKAESDVKNYKEKIEKEKNRLIQQYDEFDAQREIAELEKGALKELDKREEQLSKNIDQMKQDYEKGLKTVSEQVTTFNASEFVNDESRRLGEKIQKEKDHFLANSSTILLDLGKKYGSKLAMYLLWKYGPQPSYDGMITELDMRAYETWEQPETNIVKRQGTPFGVIAALGAVAVGVYAMS